MNPNQDNFIISRTAIQEVADFLPYPFIIAEVIDGKHLNTYLNEKFQEEICYTLEEIPTIEAWYEMAYPDKTYRDRIIETWDNEEAASKKRGEISVKIKSLVTCKNGSKRWYQVKASVINQVHVVSFVDLDKEIRLQEELKNINRNNDRMLSILGHDLRSPVANLMSLSSMAVNTEISKDEFTELIHMINGQSMQVMDMLENTLNWAKLNFNAIKLNVSQIDFNILIRNILLIYQTSYQAKNITISVNTENALVLRSDMEILVIIVRNLLSNAIKFTPQNGTINIRTTENELIIHDSGIGMSQLMIADIKSNQYNSRSGTDNEIGKGMGLQLVLNLAEKINCTLAISSEEHSGTEIRLTF